MAHLRRAPLALLSLLGGGAVALCAVFLHDYAWGLALGVVTTVAALVALPARWWARFAFALGWVAVLWRATTERPEGDYLVSSDLSGYTLLVFGMVVLAAGVAGLLPRARRATGDSEAVEPSP